MMIMTRTYHDDAYGYGVTWSSPFKMSFCGDKSLFWSHHERYNNNTSTCEIILSFIFFHNKARPQKILIKKEKWKLWSIQNIFKSQILGSESYYDIDKVLDKKLK